MVSDEETVLLFCVWAGAGGLASQSQRRECPYKEGQGWKQRWPSLGPGLGGWILSPRRRGMMELAPEGGRGREKGRS